MRRYFGVLFVAVLLAAGLTLGRGVISPQVAHASCAWHAIAQSSVLSISYYNWYTGFNATANIQEEVMDDCAYHAFGRTHAWTSDGFPVFSPSVLLCREGWDFGPNGGMKGQTSYDWAASGRSEVWCQDNMPVMTVPSGSAPWSYDNGWDVPDNHVRNGVVTTYDGISHWLYPPSYPYLLAQICCY